jgi:FKBP-type peptidyl-prolyl cis-trans isomerase FklB
MAVLGVMLLTAQVSGAEPGVLKTQKEKVSYAVGAEVAKSIKQQGIDLDVDVLLKAVKDVLSAQNLLMTDDEIRKTTATVHAELKQKRMQGMRVRTKDAEENRKEGEAFLAENKTKEGVVTLPSGLQYRILKAGDGKKPSDADTVECHYRGTLINGTEFDGTEEGKPANLKVSALIPGWKEAMKLMLVGSKWQIFIPPQLAYGERGVGRDIGPNATLIFEVELLAIK